MRDNEKMEQEGVVTEEQKSKRIHAIVYSCDSREELAERIVRLEDEGAKLRELVKAFDWCTEHFDLPNKCDKCPLEQSDKLTPECEVYMRELGIEVD